MIKNHAVKKTEYNAKSKNIEDKIPDFTNLATKTIFNAKINEVIGEIPSITYLIITAFLTAIQNKIPNVCNVVKRLTVTQKFNKVKKVDY